MKSIIDYFVEKAEALGISGLAAAMKGATILAERESGSNYRIQYLIGDEGDDYLTIYGSGDFDCEYGGKFVDGKLPPPHAKSWIRKLIKDGKPVDFARSEWGNYYGFRHGLRKEP